MPKLSSTHIIMLNRTHEGTTYQNTSHKFKSIKRAFVLKTFTSIGIVHCNKTYTSVFYKIRVTSNKLIIFTIIGTTNLSFQIDEGNETSCQPRPPILYPQLGGSFITPLRKPPFCILTSLLVYQGFQLKPPHRRGSLIHLYP